MSRAIAIAVSIVLALCPLVTAIPALLDLSTNDDNPRGKPFINAVLALQPAFSPRFSLFRRQGCPNLTLLCPNGNCCSYDTSCCGNTCCESGFLCTGGTASAPCCVAITSPTNECGGSNGNGNPCAEPGDVPCNGINICCPPDNLCYYDSSNIARCSPLSPGPGPSTTTSESTPFTTSTTTTSESTPFTPFTTTTSESTPFTPFTTTTSESIPFTPLTPTTPTPFSTSTPTSTTESTSFTTTIPIPTTPTPRPPTPFPDPPSSSDTFWKPATIGGIAGGAAGVLILLLLLICLCARRRRGSNSQSRSSVLSTSVQPLTAAEIYTAVQGLVTTQEWQEVYNNEAVRTRGGQHLDRCSWMKDFGTRAVQIRIQQLRDGGERSTSMWKAGAIAFVPLVKYWGWFRDSTKRFNRVVIDALGLGDTSNVESLYRGAKAAADKSSLLAKLQPGIEWVGKRAFDDASGSSDLAQQLQQELAAYLQQELGEEAAMELMAELVHLKPVIGQIISGTRAMWKCDQKMLKALDWLHLRAIDFHLKVFAVNALAETFPEEFGVQSGEK